MLREEQFTERRLKDFADALDREAVSFVIFFYKYLYNVMVLIIYNLFFAVKNLLA